MSNIRHSDKIDAEVNRILERVDSLSELHIGEAEALYEHFIDTATYMDVCGGPHEHYDYLTREIVEWGVEMMEAAKGRPIYLYADDESGEECNYYFIGEEDEIVAKLQKIR